MSNLLFSLISFHHVEAVDNYNKEKLITTNIVTSTTGINETTKMPLLKLFLYFSIRDNVTMITLYIYIYIEQKILTVELHSFEAPGTVHKKLKKLVSIMLHLTKEYSKSSSFLNV